MKKCLEGFVKYRVFSLTILSLISNLGPFSHIGADGIKPSHNSHGRNSIVKASGTNVKKLSQVASNRINEKDIYPGLRMIAEVIDLIESKAYRTVNFKQFIEEALKNAVPFCDAHSSFFPPQNFIETKEATAGKFPGIGISVISKSPADDEILITDVIENGPSQKADVRPNDKIVEIDGAKLRGLSSDEVINKLRGPLKSKVAIKLIRQKEMLEKVITRDLIHNEVTSAYHFKAQNVYYLSLRLFTENASASVASILEKANKEACQGFVLDIRRNPGGILETAVDISSLFVDKGSLVVSTKDRNHKIVSQYKTTTEPVLKTSIPIFVLMDNFSASSSEILAGCLRYYSEQASKDANKKQLMIFLLGTQTFGKGSVQEVIPISNNCALKLTTMLYYLPNNESIQATGITPDFIVKQRILPEEEMKVINDFSGRESSLQRFITRQEVDHPEIEPAEKPAKEKDAKELSWEEKRVKGLTQDVQIQAALNMINLLGLVRTFNPILVDNRAKALAFLKKNYIVDNDVEITKIR